LQHLTIIVAADRNNAIVVNGQLPWHLPQDLKFFKNTTWAMPIIMGRKTFDSVGKPLQGRTNIVITSNTDWQYEGVLNADNLINAIELAKTLEAKEIFIVGGGRVYAEALPLVNRVYLTRVGTDLPLADTWFPVLPSHEWEMKWERPFCADEKHAFEYSFQCWERIAGV
jgi:dihydrofolate reductase